MALNDKQSKFVKEYLVDLNSTQAAIRAGYSTRTAGSIGFELLKKPEIATEIRRELELRSIRTEITQDRVLLEIARLAFNDPRKAFDENGALKPIQEWPDEVAAAVSSIKINEITDSEGNHIGETKEIKFWDKGKQIELAGRHLGMWNDKLTLGGDKNNPILTKTLTDTELERIITGSN